ncbi:uncharacterized protein V2V93DRAFT_373690 [Kockiozyma suomiensis]|uniref:uncharacterized protein n=1 Tax=Kockiozyma suomiensis TaxID=1337062 RepID=UPI0033435268
MMSGLPELSFHHNLESKDSAAIKTSRSAQSTKKKGADRSANNKKKQKNLAKKNAQIKVQSESPNAEGSLNDIGEPTKRTASLSPLMASCAPYNVVTSRQDTSGLPEVIHGESDSIRLDASNAKISAAGDYNDQCKTIGRSVSKSSTGARSECSKFESFFKSQYLPKAVTKVNGSGGSLSRRSQIDIAVPSSIWKTSNSSSYCSKSSRDRDGQMPFELNFLRRHTVQLLRKPEDKEIGGTVNNFDYFRSLQRGFVKSADTALPNHVSTVTLNCGRSDACSNFDVNPTYISEDTSVHSIPKDRLLGPEDDTLDNCSEVFLTAEEGECAEADFNGSMKGGENIDSAQVAEDAAVNDTNSFKESDVLEPVMKEQKADAGCRTSEAPFILVRLQFLVAHCLITNILPH